MTLGEKIRQLRTEKGLSQEKFGKQTGIHPKHVGKYETNKTIPSADKLRKIAEALEVSADYLLFDNVPKAGKVKIKDQDLLEKFLYVDDMTEKYKATIKEVIDAIIIKSKVKKMI